MTSLDLSKVRRNAQGRIWIDALDGADVDLDALIDDSAEQLGGGAPPPSSGDEAPAPPSLGARFDALLRRARAASWRDALFAIGGLLLLVMAVSAIVRGGAGPGVRPRPTPTTAATALPTLAPTAAPPTAQLAYDAPGGHMLGTIPLSATLSYQHSAWPGWAGVAWQGHIVWVAAAQERLAGLPDLAPPPTVAPAPPRISAPDTTAPQAAPDRGCDPLVNPIYVVEQDVTGPNGEPWGHARGVSCVSGEEAQHNMEQQAAAVRANVATADAAAQPTATPDRNRQ